MICQGYSFALVHPAILHRKLKTENQKPLADRLHRHLLRHVLPGLEKECPPREAATRVLGELVRRHAGARGLPAVGLARPDLTDERFERLDFRDLDPSHLGALYEQMLARDARRRKVHGVYYTPAEVVAHLVEKTFAGIEGDARVLDPAMGCGRFLVAALDRLAPPCSSDDVRRRVLENCLFGVDLDPVAVDLAKAILWLHAGIPETTPAMFDGHLMRGDALDHRLVRSLAGDGFDVVLGNPPYLSFSGRQAGNRPGPLVDRWDSLQGRFLRASLDWCRGRIGLVVPDQVGHLAGYGSLRREVAGRARLIEVRYWGEKVFRSAVTPALTLVAEVGGRGTTSIVSSDSDGNPRRQNVRISGDGPWTAPSPFAALLEKIAAGSASLGPLVGDPGVHTGNCGKKLIVPLGDRTVAEPILEGRQIGRYCCAPPTKGLRTDYRPGPGEYFTIRPQSRYLRSSFLIRQTAAWPIVGPRRGAVYFRNSLLALDDPDDGIDARYYVGLLNSRLLRFWYRQSIQESGQRAFPQVKVASLRRLPIRKPDLNNPGGRRRHDGLVALVAAMLEAAAADPPDRVAISRLDRQIDRAVYAIYGMTRGEIAIIEKQCGVPPAGTLD